MRNSKTFILLSLLSITLSACDSLKFWREPLPEPCPNITILKDAATLTQYKEGNGRDLIDVLFEAKIDNVLSNCIYNVDYDTRAGLIHIQVAPVIAATRGPADFERSGEFPYFIAVVDEDKKILQKNVFSIKMGFPGNLTQNTAYDDPVDLTIKTDGSKDGSNYEIYVGFQLNREQIEYNRRLLSR